MAIDKHGPRTCVFASDVDGHSSEVQEYTIPLNMVVAGLNISRKNQNSFMMKCRDGDIDGVVRHLANPASVNVNTRDSVGMTPLMWAAFSGHIEIARRLLHAGASPYAIDEMRGDFAATALDYALGCGLPLVEGDSEDEGGPTEPNQYMAALIRSFMTGPATLN